MSPVELRVSEVILSPTITFNARQEVKASALARFHELAHEQCFIANSVKTEIVVEPVDGNG